MTQNDAKSKQNTQSTSGIKLTGGVTGTVTTAYVSALQGQSLTATSPSTDQILAYTGSTWAPTNINLHGDVTGTNGSATVAAIEGRAVQSGTPTNGYVLTWIAANNDWEPSDPAARALVTGVTIMTTSYTLATTDIVIVNNSAASYTLSLPGSATVGRIVFLSNQNPSYHVTVSGGLINGSGSINVDTCTILVCYDGTHWNTVGET